MREKATRFWSVVKVEQVKLRQQKCLCGTLPFWVAGQLLKDGQLNNKSLKYDTWLKVLLLEYLNNLMSSAVMHSFSFLTKL